MSINLTNPIPDDCIKVPSWLTPKGETWLVKKSYAESLKEFNFAIRFSRSKMTIRGGDSTQQSTT